MERWKKCVEFHGHECGGLAIGYKAAQYAEKLLNLTFSDDEQVNCISENDACGIDAIQVMLGCSVGKGNLLFHMTGKQAFSIYNRKTGESVRLVLKPKPRQMTKAESFTYYHNTPLEELFDVKETTLKLPEEARISSQWYVINAERLQPKITFIWKMERSSAGTAISLTADSTFEKIYPLGWLV